MRPTGPGLYRAREIVFGLGTSRMPTTEQVVEIVAGVPNERNHALLVATGLKHPKWKALDCYEFIEPLGNLGAMRPDAPGQTVKGSL